MTYIKNKKEKIKIYKTNSPTVVYPLNTNWQMISDSVISYSCSQNASDVYYSHTFQLAGMPDASSWANIKIVQGSSSANNSTIGDFTDIEINSKEYGFSHGGDTSYRSGLVKSEFVIDTWSGDKKIGLAIALWNNNNEMSLNGMDIFDNTRHYLGSTLLSGISNTIIYSIL
tara:strand:- start:146 stop:658 length:513 start_codon:yes stop_codon:yes gene_type:complete